jgi:hypothetical protein
MKIISASRRTDIPAFYAEWFMNRIHAGYVRWQNPFSWVPYTVCLRPEDVSAIVFWSKNYSPLLPHLEELNQRGYGMVFHFTITGLPPLFEPLVPGLDELLESARQLASRYGPEAVLWRYDPIVISNATPSEYHMRRFREIASALEGSTKRCHFSFAVFYSKVVKNTARLQDEAGIECRQIPLDEQLRIATALADIAAEHGIQMYSCCGEHLVDERIMKAHCVDGELLQRLFPDKIGSVLRHPTRKQCGCYESTDIGAYNTCPHGCVYCYANAGKEVALSAHGSHDPASDMLAGNSAAEAKSP